MKLTNYHIGEKFNHVTILEPLPDHIKPNGQPIAMVKCQCDCKNQTIFEASLSNILRGNTRSCGCYKKSNLSKLKRLDLTGQRFGRLTALEIAKDENGEEIKNNSGLLWRCKCDCGNEVFVPATVLRQHKTISCGCYAKELIKERSEKDHSGDKIGSITALYKIQPYDQEHGYKYQCRCDCGWEGILNLGQFLTKSSQPCPNCQKKSNGEAKIEEILKSNKIEYIREFWFDDCRNILPLPFDFYLPTFNCVIEFQGEHHYRPVIFHQKRTEQHKIEAEYRFIEQQKRDKIKKDYCKEKGIYLLEISYEEKNNIGKKLEEFFQDCLNINLRLENDK